jgi:hypothetical protein
MSQPQSGVTPPPAFDPFDYPLGLYLDAIASPVTRNESNQVSQWADLSGNNNHSVQPTLSRQPIYEPTGLNGLPTISQAGFPQYMILTNEIGFANTTWFWTVSCADNSAVLAHMGSEGHGSSTASVFSGLSEFYDGSSFVDSSISVTNNVPFVHAVSFKDGQANTVSYKNGNALTRTDGAGGAWTTNGYDLLGTRRSDLWNWNGKYSSVIAVLDNLGTPDVLAFCNYLKSRYAIV